MPPFGNSPLHTVALHYPGAGQIRNKTLYSKKVLYQQRNIKIMESDNVKWPDGLLYRAIFLVTGYGAILCMQYDG